ncbi:hypothetical protein LCGC14_0723800 [marine sediment metagenome]|uniref:Uncharacterized protein n=1 Tax=marine sediment metagenome TaxID=412755 RepID=A0A0F9QFT6_9ZZZZ
MPRKFSWLTFFIILFSTSSICLLFIPYQETKHLDQGYPIESQNSNNVHLVQFPWRSFNQKIYVNISVFNGTISLQIIERSEFVSFFAGEPYSPYWKVDNITVFEETIQITPPFQGYILVYVEKTAGDSVTFLLYSEITVYYLRYASSYGFVFLGVAVILISSYWYRRYKWR